MNTTASPQDETSVDCTLTTNLDATTLSNLCSGTHAAYTKYVRYVAAEIGVSETIVRIKKIRTLAGVDQCTPTSSRNLEEATDYQVDIAVEHLSSSLANSVSGVLQSATFQSSGVSAIADSMAADGYVISISAVSSISVHAAPTASPTVRPTGNPSKKPSAKPTAHPSEEPSFNPSVEPSAAPTKNPITTSNPSPLPSHRPTPPPSPPPTHPTPHPTTKGPTPGPTTRNPTPHPTTANPTTLAPTPEPSSAAPTPTTTTAVPSPSPTEVQKYTVRITVNVNKVDKQSDFCNAIAIDLSGSVSRCDAVDLNEDLVAKHKLQIDVSVPDAKTAKSSEAKTSASVGSAAQDFGITLGDIVVTADLNGQPIITTTTEAPSVAKTLTRILGDDTTALAEASREDALNTICSSGAYDAIVAGLKTTADYDKRYEQYMEWWMDNFGGKPVHLPEIPGKVELNALRAVETAGADKLKDACDEIGALTTLSQIEDVSASVANIISNGNPDVPPVTIWSALYHQTEVPASVVDRMHTTLVDDTIANEVFVHYCKSGAEKLTAFVEESKHYQAVVAYGNGLAISNKPLMNLTHEYHEHAESFLALSEINEADKKKLCITGEERYGLGNQTVKTDFWDNVHDKVEKTTVDYVAAELGQANNWSAEQVRFLQHGDALLWGAFAGENFKEFKKSCSEVSDMLPVDLWDAAATLQWKTHQNILRKKANQCFNEAYGGSRKLEEVESKMEMSTDVCVSLSGTTGPVKKTDLFSYEELMSATLTCKKDLIEVLEMMENNYDDKNGDSDYFATEILPKVESGEKIAIGALAYWSDDQKMVMKKWHDVVEAIYLEAWARFIDTQAKFCTLAAKAKKDQVVVLSETYSEDSFNMTARGEVIKHIYTPVDPPTKSGYLHIVNGETKMEFIEVPQFVLIFNMGGLNPDTARMDVIQAIQKEVDVFVSKGESQDGMLHLHYDLNQTQAIALVENFAKLYKDGVTLNDGKKVKIASVQLPIHFEDVTSAYSHAGIKVSHPAAICLLHEETGTLEIIAEEAEEEEEETTAEPTTTTKPTTAKPTTVAPTTLAPTTAPTTASSSRIGFEIAGLLFLFGVTLH